MKCLKWGLSIAALQFGLGIAWGVPFAVWLMWGCAGDISCAIQEIETWIV